MSMNKRQRERANAFAAKLAKSQGWAITDGTKYYEAEGPRARAFWAIAKMAHRHFRRKHKPLTKAQLWEKVLAIAGKLIVGNGLQSNYLLPNARLFDSDDPADNIRDLISYARHLGDCNQLVTKLEKAFAAWETA